MNIGKLKKVDIRKVWPAEDRDFTPWVKEHIEELADKIGVGLIDVERESAVGKYSVDLVGVVEESKDKFVLENQFGQTDHDHLGKLLTYAAGKDAKLGVWVAEKFRDEHVAALEYLNENTLEDGLSFFGIEICVKKIGDSNPAPEFNIVVKPNEWKKMVSQAPLSGADKKRRSFRLDFFGEIADEYKAANPSWHKVKAQPNHWLSFGSGTRGCAFGWVFRSVGGYRFAVELYIDRGDKEENEQILNKLLKKRDKIEQELGFKLDFQILEDKRACRIEYCTPMSATSTKLSEKELNKLTEWGVVNMQAFSGVLKKHLDKIKI